MATRLLAPVVVTIGHVGHRFAPGPVDADAPIAAGVTLRSAVRKDLLVDEPEPEKAAPVDVEHDEE